MDEDKIEDIISISANSSIDYNNISGNMYGTIDYSNISTTIPSITVTNGTTPSGGYLYSTGASYSWGASPSSNLSVSGDAEIEGDLRVGGVSIKKSLEAINDRLAILQPNPEKLEKYEALRKAYEHYKLLEKLVQED
jgi:hypothetical protein